MKLLFLILDLLFAIGPLLMMLLAFINRLANRIVGSDLPEVLEFSDGEEHVKSFQENSKKEEI